MHYFGHRPGSVNGPLQLGSFRRNFLSSLRAARLTYPSWRFTIRMITSTCWPARRQSQAESWPSGGTPLMMQGPQQDLHPVLRKAPQIWRSWSLPMMSWRVLVKTSTSKFWWYPHIRPDITKSIFWKFSFQCSFEFSLRILKIPIIGHQSGRQLKL